MKDERSRDRAMRIGAVALVAVAASLVLVGIVGRWANQKHVEETEGRVDAMRELLDQAQVIEGRLDEVATRALALQTERFYLLEELTDVDASIREGATRKEVAALHQVYDAASREYQSTGPEAEALAGLLDDISEDREKLLAAAGIDSDG